MVECFHASKAPLTPGTVLEPRFVRPEIFYQFQAVQSAMSEPPETRAAILKAMLLADIVQNSGQSRLKFAVKETILEHVRAKEFPERISRYVSIFLSPTKRDAELFRDLVKDRQHLYACAVSGEPFTADLRYVGSPNPYTPMLKQIEAVLDQARRYWAGEHSEAPILECLSTPSTVTITAACDW